MNKLLVVTAVLLNKNQQVLVEKHKSNPKFNDLWQCPGGKVEENESLKAALKRELLEELAINVKEQDLEALTFTSYNNAEGKEVIVFYYMCYSWQGEVVAFENQELEFIEVVELLKRKNIPFNNEAIKALAAKVLK